MTSDTAPAVPDQMLDESEVVAWLRSHDVAVADDARVTRLSGGVSSVVLVVEDARSRRVVKQSLAKLAVPGDWRAPRERILVEAAALRVMSSLVPGHAPDVEVVDERRLAIAMSAAPADADDWRNVLASGRVDADVARVVGEVLGALHVGSPADGLPDALRHGTQLDSLRLDPYFRSVAAGHPELADPLLGLVDELAGASTCLVHGDYSPKNLLVWPDHLWAIDAEVAHVGEPAFDVAFLTHHLVMDALVWPERARALDACWQAYSAGYASRAAMPPGELLDRLTGGLLLARVHGKSPAAYLTGDARDAADRLGRRLLCGDQDVATGWAQACDGGVPS